MKTKLTRKQLLGNLLLFFGLIAVTFFLLLRGQNPRELWQAIRSARVSMIGIAIGCMCVFVLSEGAVTWQCLRLFGCRSRLKNNIFYALVGFFFSSVTPSASGGQPMQLYYMHRDRIAVPTAALALLVQFSVFQIVTIACAAVGFGTQYAQLVQEGGAFRYAFLLGTAVNAALLAITLAMIFSKRASEKILHLLVRVLTCLHYKKANQMQQQLTEQLALYQRGTQYLRRIPFSPLRPWKRCCMSVCLRCRCPVPSARAKGRFCCCFARLFRAVRCNMQCCSAAASASICLSHAAAARLPCGSCFSPTNKRSRKKTRAFVILCNFFVSMQ